MSYTPRDNPWKVEVLDSYVVNARVVCGSMLITIEPDPDGNDNKERFRLRYEQGPPEYFTRGHLEGLYKVVLAALEYET